MWDDVPVAIYKKLTEDEDFGEKCGRYYIYVVPDDWEYPYVTSFSVESESWMTVGNTVSGEMVAEYPFWVHSDSPKDCREVTSVINSVFHYIDELDGLDGYALLSSRRAVWTKPFRDEEGRTWYQLISFQMNFEKED